MTRQNYYHKLWPNDDLNMQDNFIFFDTEAYLKKIDKDTEEQTFRMGWLKYKNFENDREEYYFYDTIDKFWDYVECHVGPKELYLIAHNTDYDIKITDGFKQMLLDRGWQMGNWYIEANVFKITLKKNNRSIHIWDSKNFMNMSLASLGKSMGIPKMPKPNFYECKDDELSIYCKNDTLILSTMMEGMREFLDTNNYTKLKSTAGAIAFNTFKHSFYDYENKPIHIHDYKDVIKAERRSYRGGICDCFKVGAYDEKLVKLDINSMYPYVMKNFAVPVEYLYYRDNPSIDKFKELMKTHHIIADCTIEIPEGQPYILTAIKIEGQRKSVFLKGKYKGTYSTPELEYILKHGKIHKIGRMHVYRKDIVFDRYVDELYSKRLKYESEGNFAFAGFCKILLNSLYGKFGQKNMNVDEIDSEGRDIDDSDMPDIYSMRCVDESGCHTRVRLGTKRYKMTKSDENSFDSFVAIASIITAQARMYLIEMINTAKKENVYYADTDCIIMRADKMHLLNDYMDDGTKQLGKLKNEGFSNLSIFIRPKYYFFDGKWKCKGVRSSVFNHEDDELSNVILDEDDDVLKVEQQQFERFKTSLRLGNMNKVVVRQLKKTLSKIYDKGHVKDGIVYPYDAKEVQLCTMK